MSTCNCTYSCPPAGQLGQYTQRGPYPCCLYNDPTQTAVLPTLTAAQIATALALATTTQRGSVEVTDWIAYNSTTSANQIAYRSFILNGSSYTPVAGDFLVAGYCPLASSPLVVQSPSASAPVRTCYPNTLSFNLILNASTTTTVAPGDPLPAVGATFADGVNFTATTTVLTVSAATNSFTTDQPSLVTGSIKGVLGTEIQPIEVYSEFVEATSSAPASVVLTAFYLDSNGLPIDPPIAGFVQSSVVPCPKPTCAAPPAGQILSV